MSTSTDSCTEYHHRIESSKLLPLFEQLQAIGFPISMLENNIQKLKLGSASIAFIIYTHIYRTFRYFFVEINRPLDQYILNDKVIDREKFARDFFLALNELFNHEQALPLYQYICPGHPLSKTEEIAKIARKLRLLWRDSQSVSTGAAGRPLNRSLSSTKAVNHKPASSAKIHLARIAPTDIPWQAVKESGLRVPSAADDSGELDSSDDDHDDDAISPDEGIRSWQASSSVINKVPVERHNNSRGGREGRQSSTERVSMDREDGLRTMLDRFEKMESHQNTRFRSIEDHLTQLERELSSSNLQHQLRTTERLDSHEVRIDRLEQTPAHVHETHGRSRKSAHNHHSATLEHDTAQTAHHHHRNHSSTDHDSGKHTAAGHHGNHSATEQDAGTHHHNRSPSPPLNSPNPKIAEMEAARRRNIGQHRSASVATRPLTGNNAALEHSTGLHDSGFSTTHHHHHNGGETSTSHHHQHEASSHQTSQLHHSTSHSNYFEAHHVDAVGASAGDHEANHGHEPHGHHRESAMEGRDSRETRSRHGSQMAHARGGSRSQSVAPTILPPHVFAMSPPVGDKAVDDTALLDLDERIRLRLKERIKTAEDTLNACMETIRKDYVLIRRHN